MIALVQRVSRAEVRVREEADGAPGTHRAAIGVGLCVLLGVETGDRAVEADWAADKLARLRIFADDEGRMNRSVLDVRGAILLVSQFTLAGDVQKGNRPSFVGAAPPAEGAALYERVATRLRRAHGLDVGTGSFGASMEVELVNDGPVTIIVPRRPS